MADKLTPWFPGSVKPAMAGVYQRDSLARPYAYWTGSHWMVTENTPALAVNGRQASQFQQGPRWRGLASRPKGHHG